MSKVIIHGLTNINKEKKLTYVCSQKCYNSILPFCDLDNIDLISTFYGNIYNRNPCKKCKRDCIEHFMDYVQCVVCGSRTHLECADVQYSPEEYDYICSEKCLFPFSHCSPKKFDELFPYQDGYPCKKCCGQCILDCIECEECRYWLHYECAGLSEEEFISLGDNINRDFFCRRCEMRQHPFHSVSDGTLKIH